MLISDFIKGQFSSKVLYPAAQLKEGRRISPKYAYLKRQARSSYLERRRENLERLIYVLEYAKQNVPYYEDLFRKTDFEPESLRKDFRYFQSIPYLTKDIVLEEGGRLISRVPAERVHECFTSGSTGVNLPVYYDQEAADWSSAVTLFLRGTVGKKPWMKEVHFASRFPREFPLRDRVKEWVKCLVMNRENIFVSELSESELMHILKTLRRYRPVMVHGHPSTLYFLARFVMESGIKAPRFRVFESTGESLDAKQAETIAKVFGCMVVNRYGLAEFGVVAYSQAGDWRELQVVDTFVYPEMRKLDGVSEDPELVFTSLRNLHMPLIRYRTGDRGEVRETSEGLFLNNLSGRIHEVVEVNGKKFLTHYIQDTLDRIPGIIEFQIRIPRDSGRKPLLLLVIEEQERREEVRSEAISLFENGFEVDFRRPEELEYVGWRSKFSHVIRE